MARRKQRHRAPRRRRGTGRIGKTGLLRAARKRSSPTTDAYSRTRGELERHFPFGLVHQLLDAIVYGAEGDEREAVFAGAAQLAAGLFASTGARRRRHRGLPAAARIVLAAGERRHAAPLLVIVDDAQWADEASLTFLAFLIRRLDDVPILLVVATRPAHGEGRPLLTQLVADPSARCCSRRLSQAAVGSWLKATLDHDADSRSSTPATRRRRQPAARVRAGPRGASRRLTPTAATSRRSTA